MLNYSLPPIQVSVDAVQHYMSSEYSHYIFFKVGKARVRLKVHENDCCIPIDGLIDLIGYVISPEFESLVANNQDPEYVDYSQGERLAQLRVAMINKILANEFWHS